MADFRKIGDRVKHFELSKANVSSLDDVIERLDRDFHLVKHFNNFKFPTEQHIELNRYEIS